MIENSTIAQLNKSCCLSNKTKIFYSFLYIIMLIGIIITIPLVIPSHQLINTNLMKNEVLLNNNTKWKENGTKIAGGNGKGIQLNQLNNPIGIYIYNDKTIYISDYGNHRILKWIINEENGKIVAGGNGKGNENNQLSYPTDIIIDKLTDTIIICDQNNKRIIQWPRQYGLYGKIILNNIQCFSLAIDNQGFIYYSDIDKLIIKRFKIEKNYLNIINDDNENIYYYLNQLIYPTFIFIDKYNSIYVSDTLNDRIIKWIENAKQGIIIAGGQGFGKNLSQLYSPMGLFVDQSENLYILDSDNHRIMRWNKGDKQGQIILHLNQFIYSTDLSFDQYGNIYLVDSNNHQILKYSIQSI